MARHACIVAFAWVAAGIAQAVTTSVVDIPTRGVTQRILYLDPGVPAANLLLFAGGSGALGIDANGNMATNNALCAPSVRNRAAFAAQGYAVAAVDVASDGRSAVYEDILEVVRYMQRRSPVPTWIMSVSASTVPVAAFAGRAPMPNGVGVVLVSPGSVAQSDALRIGGPASVVYHTADTDQAAAEVYGILVNARPKELVAMSGGDSASCLGPHTLTGLDAPFVAGVVQFVNRATPAMSFVSLDNAVADAVEFYDASLDHYFITHVAGEIALLDAGVVIKGWTRTGQSFKVLTHPGPGTSPVCRFYIPPTLGDSHFYGRGTAECDATQAAHPSLVNEDPQFFHTTLPAQGRCSAGMRNVYRVFSGRADANHRYTADAGIRDAMVAKGWIAEGDGPDLVVMCAPL